jgi:hypothetical protein
MHNLQIIFLRDHTEFQLTNSILPLFPLKFIPPHQTMYVRLPFHNPGFVTFPQLGFITFPQLGFIRGIELKNVRLVYDICFLTRGEVGG